MGPGWVPVPGAGSTETQLGPRALRPLHPLLWDLRERGAKINNKHSTRRKTDISSLEMQALLFSLILFATLSLDVHRT